MPRKSLPRHQETQPTVTQDDNGLVGVVYTDDTRQRVPLTTAAPARWVGQLTCTWPGKAATIGTATLLDDSHILTCAHNFWDNTFKISCSQAVFTPGLNRSATGVLQRPYGSYELQSWSYPSDYMSSGPPPPPPAGLTWREITPYLNDYAIGVLQDAVPDPPGESLFQAAWPGDGQISQLTCMINGYSGDLDQTASTQYTRTGNVALTNQGEFLFYRMSTYHGDSGAPVYYQPANRDYWSIIGVHVSGVQDTYPGAGDGRNFAVALNGDPLDFVQSLLNGLQTVAVPRG
ncbi:MAG: hypothetical protein ABSA93_13620 [Streptosporangiaceae bacterium]|jgi:glutamyl endopeptidase